MKDYFTKRNKFTCPKCGHHFEVSSFWDWLAAPHVFDKFRYVKCPKCKEKCWMKIRGENDEVNSN